MNSQERTQELNRLGSAIAQAITNLQNPLASAWRYVTPTEDTYSTYCVNAEGARIYFQHAQGNETRLSISGWLHIGKNTQYVQVYDKDHNRLSAGEITVGIYRGVENIAKEILRRFLPHYLEVFALAQCKVKDDARYEASVLANLTALSKAACLTLPYHDERRNEVLRTNSGSTNGFYIKLTASATPDEQQLDIDHLTVEQAAYILNYLKAQPQRKG